MKNPHTISLFSVNAFPKWKAFAAVALLRRDAAKSQKCKMQMQKSAAYFRAAAELPASPTLKASLVAALVYTASSLYFICSSWSGITEAQCLPTYATS